MRGEHITFDAAGAARLRLATERPTIPLLPGECPEAVDAAEEVLVANAERLQLFQRAGEVVKIIELDKDQKTSGLSRKAGTVQLLPVGQVALTEVLDRLAVWEQVREGEHGQESRRVDCPGRIATAYLARIGEWRLPHLVGVIAAQIMRPDGTVLDLAGYDPATGLYLVAGDWLPIPASPSRADALAALEVLASPFDEFPFVAAEDRSVLLTAILTAIQRRLLPSAPMFGFTAPTQRTGKSALAEAVAIIATGKPAPAMAASGEREELRKAVTASLREGHAVINLDNVEHPLGSPDLARAITQIEYGDRILGESRNINLPTNLLWTATGNNLAFRGDLAVRVVLCRLDARMERPEERHFAIADLPAYLIAHRPRLVQAALTILRAYHVAGRPDQHLAPWGGFAEWSATIRSALVWLGEADPCATRQHVIADDPERELALVLFGAWEAAFGTRAVMIAEVAGRCAADANLRGAVLAVAAGRADASQPDSRRLAGWCRQQKAKIIGGYRLDKREGDGRVVAWRLSRPEAANSVSSVSSVNSSQKKSADGPDGVVADFQRPEKTEKTEETESAPRPEILTQPGVGFEEAL